MTTKKTTSTAQEIKDKRLFDAYIQESREYVRTLNANLLDLEKDPNNKEPIESSLAALHTLKGMSATMKYDETSALCHVLEDVFTDIKAKKLPLDVVIQHLFSGLDTLEETNGRLVSGEPECSTKALIRQLQHPEKTAKKDDNSPTYHYLPKSSTISVDVSILDNLMKLAEELLVSKLQLDELAESINNNELTTGMDAFARLIAEIQYEVMQARMVPIGTIFDRFPRMVRDLSRQEKKDVKLEVAGADIKLDRQILVQIAEPLVHLIRNAVDHGIETAAERKLKKKPAQSVLRLTASRRREMAIIELQDDGCGIDWAEVKTAAMKKGIVNKNARQEDLAAALFSGLSTSKEVSSVSGRGLGLSIVKKTLGNVGGSVLVASEKGVGTTFTIEIPFTIAIANALFVKVHQKTYAIPVTSIVKLVSVEHHEIKENLGYEAIVLDDAELPLVQLNHLFGLPKADSDKQEIVVVRKGMELYGLVVDDLLSTQDIVIKQLDPIVKRNRYFSGTTIVGSGEAVLVLDVENLAVFKKRQPIANSLSARELGSA